MRYLQKKSKILDVGCGGGELVINLAKKKFDAYGIDFAHSMIKRAKLEAKKHKIPEEKFFEGSIFNYKFSNKYDMITSNGFIEYISEKELEQFFTISKKMLNKNGIFIINSRNRLF